MYGVFEQLLQKQGITAYKVSKDTGITQTLLSNWKNGKSIPNMHNLKKIADYFGVTIDYLMTGKERQEDYPTVLMGCGSNRQIVIERDGNDDKLSELLKEAEDLPKEKLDILIGLVRSMK